MKWHSNCMVLIAFVLFVVPCLVSFTQAYLAFKANAKSPDKEGFCYDDQLKIEVPIDGERQRPERCEIMRCSADYTLQIAGCGSIGPSPEYEISETDFSKDYPDCCPMPVLINKTKE